MHIPLLEDIVIILGLSMVVLLIGARLRLPSIIGFLVTGVIAGPHGLGLVTAQHEVDMIAEIGIVLLLFTIGLEFSFKELLRIKKSVLLGGSVQVVLTVAAGTAAAAALGWRVRPALFVGCLVSLSSTAIVLKLLQERSQMESPHGRTSLGILIFQDLAIVPMMLVTPFLAGATSEEGASPAWMLAKAAGIVLSVVVVAKWILPRVLLQIVRTRNPQLFLVSVVAICLAVATGTSLAGLSLSLGAFLAGLVLADSEYSHQALGNMLPFRDVFASFFFVSVGMLLDLQYAVANPLPVVAAVVAVVLAKAVLAGVATLLLGLPLRTAILVGFGLSQVGEFSFVLSKVGVTHGLLDEAGYQWFLAVSVFTMLATPFVMALAPRLADAAARLPLPSRLLRSVSGPPVVVAEAHLIIVGFGPTGRHLARAAQVGNVPYVVVEMNPDTVRVERRKGERIVFGDASDPAVLEHVGIETARIMVVVISDPAAARRAVEVGRRTNPSVHILVRTRFLGETSSLYTLGANEVIPDELESSVEVFTRVLNHYQVPRDRIDAVADEVRSSAYEKLRSPASAGSSLASCRIAIPDVDITSCRVAPGSALVGKTLSDLGLRQRYGVTLLAIRRQEETLPNPGGEDAVCESDTLVVMAAPGQMRTFARLCAQAQDVA